MICWGGVDIVPAHCPLRGRTGTIEPDPGKPPLRPVRPLRGQRTGRMEMPVMTDEERVSWADLALAVDWGGTWCRAALVDRDGGIWWQDRRANPAGGTAADYLALADGLLADALASSCLQHGGGRVFGIGNEDVYRGGPRAAAPFATSYFGWVIPVRRSPRFPHPAPAPPKR